MEAAHTFRGEPSAMSRETGMVKFWADIKGFGFILPDRGGAEVFVHKNDLKAGLLKLISKQRVSYELVNSDKGNGKRAANVRLE
jgi:CspA family cold shock protein